MVLEAVVAGVEIAAALLLGDTEALIVVQFGDPRLEDVAARQRLQIGIGDDILRRHPVAHLVVLAHVILEPAIGVGHLDAEMRLDQILTRRRRIVEFGIGGGGGLGGLHGGGLGSGESEERQKQQIGVAHRGGNLRKEREGVR